MTDRQLRTYEISVWSLQDDFITVLKPYDLTDKRFVKDPIMKLNTDGTQSFSFSLPMYIYEGAERIENPLWYNVEDGLLLVNVRKVKVILNKTTNEEQVFEFLITKVTDIHESDTLYCKVECEGLAFHELGKIGYKISLSSDMFYEEDYQWFVEAGNNEEPKANLQYWLNHFLMPLTANSTSPAIWYYDIQMDWSAYADALNRASNKIYEEPYTSSWATNNASLIPNTLVNFKEKERLVDLEESNIYNLTQDLAETFGVFCRYEYLHDDHYYITGRRIIFYNSFMREPEGYLELTYPYSSSEVQREVDSTDLVTKMFVRPVDNDNSGSGWSTIMDVDANRSLEDYIMNFDYLHDIGSIDDAQYAFINEYEAQMRKLNAAMIPIEQILSTLNERKVELSAALTMAKNAVALDNERIGQAERLYNELDKTDGTLDGVITITPLAPKTAIIMHDSNSDDANMGYINISEKGVLYNTLKIYTTIDYTSTDINTKLGGQINGTPEYDEFNNLIRINNLYYNTNTSASHMVYLTYNYKPKLYYENVKAIWVQRLAQDEADVDKYSEELGTKSDSSSMNTIYGKIAKNIEDYNNDLKQKQTLLEKFERWFGPAIREGYWQPDTYNDYGDSYIDTLTLTNSLSSASSGNSNYTKVFWDKELFDDEDDIKYTITAAEAVKYYPCLRLTSTAIQSIYDHLDDVCFIFWDTTNTSPKEARAFALGSQCQLVFVYNTSLGQVVPCLAITGATNLTDSQLQFMKTQWRLGKLTSKLNETTKAVDVAITTYHIGIDASLWLNDSATSAEPLNIYYPRIELNSLSLKTSDDQLALLLNNSLLNNYADYYILTRNGKYYITIKPQSLIGNNNKNISTYNLQLKFALSNANISIYLDALQVLKENAYPKVSYSITPSVVNDQFVYTDYKSLARIVRINDTDLKLDNVYGYISELDLNLSKPWEDNIVIQNYKNKFEDLFSKIVAQTEQMQKSEYAVGLAAGLFSNGQLSGEIIQTSLQKVDLNYAFNNGNLIIDEVNGIWGISDDGVVAYRGGGIFTATTKDDDGNWIWNTGIVPQGINADLIVAGQLDTNKIKIYAGDQIRFQLNGNGLFAYKSFMEDANILAINDSYTWSAAATTLLNNVSDELQPAQYVVMNQNGLFLVAENGAQVPYLKYTYDAEGTITSGAYEYKTINHSDGIKRVEISWNGLKLRDWNNKETFWANADTGDLYLTGNLVADKVTVLENYEDAIQDWVSATSLRDWVDNEFDDHVQVSENLAAIFTQAGNILQSSLQSIAAIDAQTIDNASILKGFYDDIQAGLKDDRTIQLYGSSSVDIYSGDMNGASTTSVLSLSKDKGVWIGSGKAVNLFSGEFPTSGNSAAGSSVSLDPNKILFGVSSTDTETVVEMTQDHAIFAAANQLSSIESATATSWTNSSVSGVKITKDGVWLGAGSRNNRSIIAITPDSLTLGAANADNSGSFIKMTQDQFTIGSSGNMYINTANIGLDTTKKQTSAIYNNVGFRLGTTTDPVLIFENNNLHVKGAITATSLYIGDNTTTIQDVIEDAMDDITIGGRNLLLDSDTSQTNTVQLSGAWQITDEGMKLTVNDTVTVTMRAIIPANRTRWRVHHFAGRQSLAVSDWISITPDGTSTIYTWTGPWVENNNGAPHYLRVFTGTTTDTSEVTIEWIKLERGNVSTDWTPAPEDTDVAIQSAVSQASSVYYQATVPTSSKQGDLWYNIGSNIYTQYAKYMYTGSAWVLVDRLISGTNLTIDTVNNKVEMTSAGSISIAGSSSVSITGSGGVSIGSDTAVTIASATSGNAIQMDKYGLSIASGGRLAIDAGNFLISTTASDNNIIKEFRLGSSDDPLLQLVQSGGTTTNPTYSLNISGNVAASLPSSLTTLSNKLAWTDTWNSNNTIPIFDETANTYPIGTLGVAYSSYIAEQTGSNVRGIMNTSDSHYLATAVYSTTGHEATRYFGRYATRWNVSRGAADTFTSDQWSRAGLYAASDDTKDYNNASATYVPIQFTKNASAGDPVYINFKWRFTPAAQKEIGWNCYSNVSDINNKNATHKQLAINLYKNYTTTATPTTLMAERYIYLWADSPALNTTYSFVDDTAAAADDTNITAVHTLTQDVLQGDVVYLTFWWPDEMPKYNATGSLRYIDQESVSIGNGDVTSASAPLGIYVKTAIDNLGNTAWKPVVQTTYTV